MNEISDILTSPQAPKYLELFPDPRDYLTKADVKKHQQRSKTTNSRVSP
jgi:hypothetical protein